VPDRPGGLASVLQPLREAGVNVEYMYAFVEKATDKAVVIFRFEDADRALGVLAKAGISVLPAQTIYSL